MRDCLREACKRCYYFHSKDKESCSYCNKYNSSEDKKEVTDIKPKPIAIPESGCGGCYHCKLPAQRECIECCRSLPEDKSLPDKYVMGEYVIRYKPIKEWIKREV